MKRIYLLLAIAAVMASCNKDKRASAEAGEAMPVDVAEAVVDSVVLSKSYPGTLSSQNSVEIVARVNGIIERQLYNSGDHVKKGQVLFVIEDTEYRDAVIQAQSALANAQSEYEYNKQHYEALAKALEKDAVAKIQVLEAKSAMEQSAAAIKNAQAALQNAQLNLGYCTIRAPFEGDMTKSNYSEKAYVSGQGAPVTLAKIYDNSSFNAYFYIDDNAYMRSVANDGNRHLIDYDNVPIKFSEQLPHSYAGKLTYMSPSVDTSTGTLSARVSIESPYGELRDGMYCTIDLPYELDEHAVLVKDASINTSQTNKFLYVVNDSNRVVYTPIEVGGMANDSMRIVTSGLKGGEKYVTKALLKVRPGVEVKPIMTK